MRMHTALTDVVHHSVCAALLSILHVFVCKKKRKTNAVQKNTMLTMCAKLWISKFQYLHLKVGNLRTFHLHQLLLTCSWISAVCFHCVAIHCRMTSSVPEHEMLVHWNNRSATHQRTSLNYAHMYAGAWDHINMTRLWKSKQLRFMSCPLSAYVVWLNTVQWLLTRHCADRCSALPFREGTHGGERTERESDTFTPRRQVACGASAHSLSLSSSWVFGCLVF